MSAENKLEKALTVRERMALHLILFALRIVGAYDYEHKFDEQVKKIKELI